MDELAGEGLLADELEVGLGGGNCCTSGAAAAMSGPVVWPVAGPARPLRLLAWSPIRNGGCPNGVVMDGSNGVLTNHAFVSVSLERD